MRHRSKITKPGHRLGVPNPNKGKRYPVTVLKRAEVDALIEGCNCGLTGLRNRAMIADLVGTGSRVSEMLGRRVDDIDWETREVHIRGTNDYWRRLHGDFDPNVWVWAVEFSLAEKGEGAK